MAAGVVRYFEDVTGNLTATVFRDALDHTSTANLKVSPLVPGLPEHRAVLEIRQDAKVACVDFSASVNSLGTISLPDANPRKIEQYLWPVRNKRGSMKRFFPSKASNGPRQFTAFDGIEYTWTITRDPTPPSSPPQPPSFICSSKDCPIVARYHALPQSSTMDGEETPAAVLEIAADSIPLLPELVATLTIMRFIQRYPDSVFGVRS